MGNGLTDRDRLINGGFCNIRGHNNLFKGKIQECLILDVFLDLSLI
jgi:hypothetical protein